MRAVDSRSHPVSEFLRAVCCAAKQYLFQLELGILVLADALTGLYIAAESGHWSSSYRGDIREQAPSLVAGDSREFNAHPFVGMHNPYYALRPHFYAPGTHRQRHSTRRGKRRRNL